MATDDLGRSEVVVRTGVMLISPGTELARWQERAGFRDDWEAGFPLTTGGYAAIGTVARGGDDVAVVGPGLVGHLARGIAEGIRAARHLVSVQ